MSIDIAKIRIENLDKLGLRRRAFLNDMEITQWTMNIDSSMKASHPTIVTVSFRAILEVVEFEERTEDVQEI